ncbi:RNA polymerase sigma factor [Niabella terrae]
MTAEIALDEQVERCRRGDRRAYHEVYQKYARPMLNSSMRVLNNLADAEDMVQEAFIDAFNSLDRFSYKSSFEAWLRRIVINKSISLIRKRKLSFSDIDVSGIEETEEDLEGEESSFQYNVERIKQAIKQLPQNHRIIFNLYTIEGLPQEEIGRMLNLSHNNVRTIYHRARKKIQELISYEQKN